MRETAEIRGRHFSLSPYDALLDMYQPGLSTVYFEPIFADLENFLPGFTDEVIAHQASQPQGTPIPSKMAVDVQKSLCERMVVQAGFDLTQGRLDVSAHPFCGGVSGDIRLTTRYDESDFVSSIMGALHETGHALYDMGLPVEWRGQPVGSQGGMMLHESQSLIHGDAGRAHARIYFLPVG